MSEKEVSHQVSRPAQAPKSALRRAEFPPRHVAPSSSPEVRPFTPEQEQAVIAIWKQQLDKYPSLSAIATFQETNKPRFEFVDSSELPKIEGKATLAQWKDNRVLVSRQEFEALWKDLRNTNPTNPALAERTAALVTVPLIAHELQHGLDASNLAARARIPNPGAMGGIRDSEFSALMTETLAALELSDGRTGEIAFTKGVLALYKGKRGGLILATTIEVLASASGPSTKDSVHYLRDIAAERAGISLGSDYNKFHTEVAPSITGLENELQKRRETITGLEKIVNEKPGWTELWGYMPKFLSGEAERATHQKRARDLIAPTRSRMENSETQLSLLRALDNPSNYAAVTGYYAERTEQFTKQVRRFEPAKSRD